MVGKRREKNLALAVETVGKSPLAAVRTTGRPVGGTLLDGHLISSLTVTWKNVRVRAGHSTTEENHDAAEDQTGRFRQGD